VLFILSSFGALGRGIVIMLLYVITLLSIAVIIVASLLAVL